MSSGQPLVSIAMITHNHEPYIQQAIQGVLLQQTDFDFELVIGEDASNDNTLQIIRDLEKSADGKIVILPESQHRLGMKANHWRTLRACKGSYIAFCEGDDYWTHHHKLQKQVNLLKSNPELSACFHRFSAIDQWGKPVLVKYRQPPALLFTRHILWHLYSRTCTVMYRASALADINRSDYEKFPHPDYYLALAASFKGKAAYMNEDMATYRFHTGGVATSLDAGEKFRRSGISRKMALTVFPLNPLEKMVAILAILKYRFARSLARLKLVR